MTDDRSPAGRQYEVVVVGAGAAGLAAATTLGRCGRRVLVVGGQDRANSTAAAVHNLPYAEGAAPAEVYAAMETELARLGVPVRRDEVQQVGETAAGLVVTGGSTDVTGLRLLLATGARHELPPWVPPGTWGMTVFDCPFCHAREHAGEDFVVVGKGKRAVETALLCTDPARSMTVLVTDPAAATGPAARRVGELGGAVHVDRVADATRGSDGTLELHTEADRRLAVGAVVLTGTLRPRTDLVSQLGLSMASFGIPETDAEGRSSHRSVWIAGMGARPEQMMAEAIGSGVRAAVSIHQDLALAGLVDPS